MKRLTFVLAVQAALMVSACSSNNQDQVNNAELNQAGTENLDALANEAATNNAEAQALGNQQDQLNQENSAATDNTVNPADADEQNVSGM